MTSEIGASINAVEEAVKRSSSLEVGEPDSSVDAVKNIDNLGSPAAAKDPIQASNPDSIQKLEKSPPKKSKWQPTPNANRPTLRPRKSEPSSTEGPTTKKVKKAPKKQDEAAPLEVVSCDIMLPPSLPLAEIPEPPPVLENPEEMPILHSETSSSASSETTRSESRPSLNRRRTKARLTHKKRKRANIGMDEHRKVPSPSLAEGNVNPAGPESSVTENEATKSSSCLCCMKPHVYVNSSSNPGDLTCQALDSIDGRVVGCCNPLPTTTVGLHRSSSRTPYIMLCSVHLQRLLRHNCCPGCGLFCTQGKYLTCRAMHQYHKRCIRQGGCPHCGDMSTPKTVAVTLKSRRDPVFLPKPKAVRVTKPAKMSVIRETVPPTVEALPVIIPPDVEKWTSGSLPADPSDPDKLAELLGVACCTLAAGPLSLSNRPSINRYTYKHLLNAVRAGDAVRLLKIMSSGINPNHAFVELKHQTPLHMAASLGHVTLIHLLLQSGLSVDLLDAELNSPLALGVIAGHHDVVKYLVKAGASLLVKGEDGMTPLHVAAKNGNLEACKQLLSAQDLPHRYVDSLDDGGWTPLVWAAEYNHIDVVRLLIAEGGDPLLRDVEQNIALHWAAYGGCVDVVDLLLSRGSDISAVNVQGDTPLHIAARQDKYDCVLLLLARGARCDAQTLSGDLPRDCAPENSPISKAISLNMELSQLIAPFANQGPRVLSQDVSRGKERDPIQCVNSVDNEPFPKDFVYVTESCFTSRIAVDRTISAMQSCSCNDNCTSGSCTCTSISLRSWYDCDGKLSREFCFTDPPMIFECNQICGCNRISCQNRVVQNGVTCRFQLFRTSSRGWGLKTLAFIPKGTYVCEYIGEIISDSEADHREDDSYLFDLDNREGETYCIDARRFGNMARFINHKCLPNLIPVHVFVEHHDLKFPRIAFFANQDIQPHEELGYNYGEKFWVIKWKTFTCTCSSEKCMYSEQTIQTTLENYERKLGDLECLN